MASDSVFYLTLPSNSSMAYFPDNTLAQFKTKLPQDIDLTGRWQVGLAEIQFPHTFYNIQNEEAWMRARVTRNGVYALKTLNPGFYPSPKDLVKCVHAMLAEPGRSEKEQKIKAGYNSITNKVHISVKRGAELILSPKLRDMLGFEQQTFTDDPGTYYASKMVDVHQGQSQAL